MSKPAEGSNVQSIERALDVLLCLAEARELGPSEIGRRIGLHKSTVHRVLKTLEARSFVIQDAVAQRYRIGPSALRVARALTVSPDLAQMSQVILATLREKTGETAVLDVRIGDDRICIAQAESEHEIRRLQRLAFPMEIHAGACGRVLLMDETDRSLDELFERVPLSQLTQNTPRSIAALRDQIARLRRDGYTISVGERVPGATTVAVPVRNGSGGLVAAMAVSAPSFRFSPEQAKAAVEALQAGATQLGSGLGTRTSAWTETVLP